MAAVEDARALSAPAPSPAVTRSRGRHLPAVKRGTPLLTCTIWGAGLLPSGGPPPSRGRSPAVVAFLPSRAVRWPRRRRRSTPSGRRSLRIHLVKWAGQAGQAGGEEVLVEAEGDDEGAGGGGDDDVDDKGGGGADDGRRNGRTSLRLHTVKWAGQVGQAGGDGGADGGRAEGDDEGAGVGGEDDVVDEGRAAPTMPPQRP